MFASLEEYHGLHYVMILAFYNCGFTVNVLASGYLASRSKLNAVKTVTQYFVLRWVPILIRWFACLCMFLFLWENPAILNLERFMPNFAAHLGVAGSLGFLCDVVWDKTLAIVFPGLQKELPPLEDATK